MEPEITNQENPMHFGQFSQGSQYSSAVMQHDYAVVNKEEYTRKYCLEMAIHACAGCPAPTEEIMKRAQAFYDFLKGANNVEG